MNERTICGQTAHRCICYKAAGHVEAGDDVHECDPARCTGAWTGDYGRGGDAFNVIRLPVPPPGVTPAPWPWESE